jgi:geranylgeranyl pyrophosphate synthase
MPAAHSHPPAGALQRQFPETPGIEPALAAALSQLVGRPGKLIRARLVLETSAALGWSAEAAEKLSAALEFFHLASLTLDDLPCMDDALERRGLPCVHRRHGEATAILAALALTNRAYRLVHEAFADRPRAVRESAIVLLDRCLGPAGLVGGQARDLAFNSTEGSVREIGRIAAAKTGALFGLAVHLPALVVPATPAESRALHSLCLYWGLAFQIVDDLRDVLSSAVNEGKTTGRDREKSRPNLALALGVTAARARLARLSGLSDRALVHLAPDGQGRWACLAAFQAEVVSALSTEAAGTAA